MKILKGLAFFSTLFFIVLLTASLFLSLLFKRHKATGIISPLLENASQAEQQFFSLFASGLDRTITTSLRGASGTYSIVVTNLKTGESYRQNPDRKYLSASLYKLWLMGAVYEELKAGTVHEDDTLEADIPSLNDEFSIASEEAELTEGVIKQTVQEALEKAIIISDNYSALLLTHKIGIKKLAAFMTSQGFHKSKLSSPPSTTASDMNAFFLKLYKKELVDEQSSEKMIELLKRQALNDRIPKYLPDLTPVAHKTGELYGNKHDAGIVFTPHGDYIFIALSETKDPVNAAERIAKLSQAVYDYFEKTAKDN